MRFHSGPYIQRGRGVGSVFRAFAQFVLPALKAIGKNIISSPTVRKLGKATLKGVKRTAVDAGLNIANDALAGENIIDSIKKNVTGQKLVGNIQNSLSKSDKKLPKQKKIKKRQRQKR